MITVQGWLYTSQAVYYNQAICCPQYSGTYPQCVATCLNPVCVHGTCGPPDTCTCSSGWVGNSCDTDIDECAEKNGGCHMFALCKNAQGSYLCECLTGYYFDNDGHTCVDKNECVTNSHTCVSDEYCMNTEGSFTCSCPDGYSLADDGHSCNDVNECLVANGGCMQECTNLVGSYNCSCSSGYYLDEVDLHNCTDIDECLEGSHICEQICLNHAGHYKCACEVGCDLQSDGSSCVDADECLEGISGCNQICMNKHCTESQYTCSCYDGYYLSNDHICIDINECDIQNGGCAHICQNIPGGFYCECDLGYGLGPNNLDCEALPCPSLYDPFHGHIECSGPQVTNEICTFSCNPGYNLTGMEERVCLPNGSWSGTDVMCPVLQCPELETAFNILIVPSCFAEYNYSCTLVCVDGYYLEDSNLFEQTCALQQDGNVSWTDPKSCFEIQPCDPNPCQNSGMCETTNKGTPSCNCDLYFKGEFCDIDIIYTPALPILLVNEQSSLLYINASTKSELQIEINSEDWVAVMPKNKLLIDPNKKVASFKLTSESVGISTIAYILQSDGFKQPSSGILLTVHTKADSENDYFSRNKLDSGIVHPGCCKKSTEFDETFCSDNLQQITFSSSCSWVSSNDQSLYMTKGITFIHTNELFLPLSVAGLDATLSSNVLDISVLSENIDCYECSDRLSLSNQCKNGNVSPADIGDMLHSKTLMNTFISNTMSMMPPQIQFKLIDTSIFGFYAYDFHASLSLPSSVSGCEGFAEQSDGLMYFAKSSNGLVITVHESQVQYYPSNNEQPICFGLEVCKGKLSPLYASFSKQAANVITTLPFFSIYKTSGWKFSVRSTSMSVYGLSSIVNNVFWNGTDNINISVPIYDTKLNMKVDGNVSNEWQTAIFKFSGSMFSNNGDDNNEQNTGIYSNVLSTTDNNDCSVSTFIHINSDVQLQWTSFATDCLNIRISKLLLVGVTSVITIPNDSSEILLSVYSHNGLDNPIALGNFITMANDRKNTYMTLDVKTSGEVNGILHGANASLFDANIIADVIFGNKLSFEAHCTIFDHYSGVLSVSAEFTTSWDTLALHVEGVLDSGNGSFQNALQSRIISYIDYLANFTKQRIAKANRNIEKSESKLNILQTEIEALEEEYETKLGKYNESLAYLGYWHDIQKEAENNLDAALKAYNISDSKKDGINELCDIQECQKICISGAKQYTCYKPMYITIDGTCNNFEPVSILTQHSQPKLVEYCEWVNSCKKKLGVKWIGPVDVGLPIPIPIPIPWIKKKCYKVCDRRQRYEMTFIDAYETVIQKVAFNCPIEAYNGSSPYTCFKYYDCVKKEDEEPCATMNNECEDMKTQALINATYATAESLQKLTAVYEDYASASSNVNMAQNNVEVIELELNLIEQEVNVTKEAYNSANFAYNLSFESYESIILDLTDEILITNWLDNHTSAYNLIALDSIEFSQELTTQTPTVFPLSITYDIPYSGMTFQTTVVIDFNSPLDFVKDTIAVVVVQHAINSVFGPYKSKRAIGKSESLNIANKFESNCLLLERGANYLLHLNSSLNDLLNDTIQSNDYVKDFIKSVEDDVNSVLSASSNVSDKYFKSLQEQKLHYLNATNASYSNLVQTVNKHAFQQWQKTMNDYHNATQSIAGETCFSFSDCLHVFIDIVFSLLIDIPDPNDQRDYLLLKLPLADAELESLALETDLSISNAIQKIHLAKDLIDSIYKLDYWCASAPNITVHPPAEVNIQHDETLSLYCLAESCLPVSYRWTKDGAIIPGSTSSELVVKKFRASDEGVYVCEAINDVQVAESIPSVVMYYQVPFFNVTPRSYTTYIGDESGVEFICDAIATPAPLWAWYFRESDNDTWEELDFETSNILYFEKPMYQNEGWYKCKVWNEFGNVTSDPVKLTLLPATIALNGYPISFAIEETVDTSYSEDFSSSGTDLDIAISIKNSLESLLTLKTTIIETVKVLPLDPNKYRIEFLLITPNATKATTIMSLESIIDNIMQYVQDLEEAKNVALYVLSDQDKTVMFYHQDYSYAIVNNSVSIQHQVFLCPEGQALHSNYFFCVGCAPGQYWSGYKTKYRSLEPGKYIGESVPECTACAKGQYQPFKQSTECISCAEYFSTSHDSSVYSTDCLALCEPGYFSYNGLAPCDECPIGMYQNQYGSNKCLPCTYECEDTSPSPSVSVFAPPSSSVSGFAPSSPLVTVFAPPSPSSSVFVPTDHGPDVLSTSAIIGIAIGICVAVIVTVILIIAIVTCGARRRRVTATFEFYQMRNETSESTNKNTYEELDNVVVYREGRKGPKLNTKEGETAFLTEFADNDHVYEEIKK